MIAPALPLAQWWGPVLAALRARADARMFTAEPWVDLDRDPVRPHVEVVGDGAPVAGGADAGGIYRIPLDILRPLWRFRPDVVIAQGFSAWTVLAVVARPLARWRVVVLWEGSRPVVDRRGSLLHSTLRRVLGRTADWVMTSNDRSRAYLTDHLGIPDDRVLVFPYLVGSPSTMVSGGRDAPELADAARPLLVAVGRLDPQKGIAELLRALAEVVEGRSLTLALVGRGPQEEELRHLTSALGLDDHVRFLGWRPYTRVGGYVEAADALVFPTLGDTWGLVAVEAMALGTPVACSVDAGASEVITDGVDGLLIDPTDHEALVAALRRLLDDVDLAEMGRAARARAAELTPARSADALWRAARHAAER